MFLISKLNSKKIFGPFHVFSNKVLLGLHFCLNRGYYIIPSQHNVINITSKKNASSGMPNKHKVIIVTPFKPNTNNYGEKLLKLRLKALLVSINHFLNITDHILFLSNILRRLL